MVLNQSVENKMPILGWSTLAAALVFGVANSGSTLITSARADAYPASELASVRTSDENKIRELRNQELEEIKRALGPAARAQLLGDRVLRAQLRFHARHGRCG